MERRKLIVVALVLLAAFVAVAPEAAAGGECNPNVIDRNCSYEEGGKSYRCSLWMGNACVADLE